MCGRYATTRNDADLSLLFDAVGVAEGPGPSWNVAPTDPVPVIRMGHPPIRPGAAGPSDGPPSARSGAAGQPDGPPSGQSGAAIGRSDGSPSGRSEVGHPSGQAGEPARPDAGGVIRVVDTARWGLVPPWATDLRAGARMINARSETVATSPAFARSFARRRCLVPADGWFEWVRDGKLRRAFYLTPADGSPLAFAGLWSAWGPESVLTCTIITTAAAGGLAKVHDRMPLILPRERWTSWLDGGGDPVEQLRPLSAAELAAIEVRPVRPEVGNVRNNGPHLLEPPDEAALF